MKNEVLTVRLEPSVRRRLRDLARRQKMSESELLRTSLRQLISDIESEYVPAPVSAKGRPLSRLIVRERRANR
jgi:hypothetical protein